MEQTRIIRVLVEKHDKGFLASPLGLKENYVTVGEGDTPEAAINDLHDGLDDLIDLYGNEIFEDEFLIQDAFVTEIKTTVKPSNAKIPN